MSVHARHLGPAFDLLATYRGPGDFFFERAGIGVSASGTARTVEGPLGDLPGLAAAALSKIRVQGKGVPIAVGALAFDPSVVGVLTIPTRLTARTSAGAWALDLPSTATRDATEQNPRSPDPNPDPARHTRLAGRSLPHEPFVDLQLAERPSASAYAGLVEAARTRIRAGAIDKVVLARTLEVDAGRAFDPVQLLWRLRAVEPDGYVFAAPTARGALVGASPELLASVQGRALSVNPLAGSAPRRGDPDEDRAEGERLLRSDKDRHEHDVVVRAVAAALAPLCDDLSYPREPVLHPTANVWHLATPFAGRLRGHVESVLSIVAALHPTPAVGGHPIDAALAAIRDLEPFDRGAYAGPVGWVDAKGNGVWAVALRCAELAGTSARLFAGAGIVAESDPFAEAEETDRKFRAFLDSLRWG